MLELKAKDQKFDFDFVNCPIEELFGKLETSATGLTYQEVKRRLHEYGPNELAKKKKRTFFYQFAAKFFNPLVIVLLIIASFSFFFGDKISADFVMAMAFMSVFLSFIQEYRAGKEAERLSEMVKATATVHRNGRSSEVKIRDLVPGDIVDLFAGDMIPADLRLLSCKDLFINQSALTGESLPIEKTSAVPASKPGASQGYGNIVFMGSNVISGTGLGVVLRTGISTQFGEVSRRLLTMRTETSFDRGIKQFTWLMIRIMMVLVGVIFCINFFLKKGSLVEAMLFSLAVSVGLTPEMLPMLVAVNLSKGAIQMSKKKVIVKRLNSIQNFGAMDIICTDKTGTLTMDKIVLEKHCDVIQRESQEVLNLAYLNSFYQTGLKNILDRAILKHEKQKTAQYRKVDEIPFDFSRRIMSVVVEVDGKDLLIAKGAPEEIFRRCSHYELDGEILEMEPLILQDLKEEYDSLSSEGYRVLAVAYKNMESKKEVYSREDEKEMVLSGYLAFLDPPKPSAKEAIKTLKGLGVDVKVLTGDNELVTKKICSEVGLDVRGLVVGDQVEKLQEHELQELVKTTNIFARLSPIQKERVIHALRGGGHIVGYLGDGINDAPALKASDVGISVDNAVDIAKESADIILLQKNLMVLEDGVIEGRKTFGNIVKYIKMGSSSNFGNMFSMTGASLLIPFLPMLPIQILLNNLLYDISQIAIPTDSVDPEYLSDPRPWKVSAIRKYMMTIGPISSIFDFITFGVMFWIFHASPELFRTGWFLESLCTQTLVIHIIRTSKKPFFESRPSRYLVAMSLFIISVGIVIPFLPLAKSLGFVQPPIPYFLILVLIVGCYLVSVQWVKAWFVKKFGQD